MNTRTLARPLTCARRIALASAAVAALVGLPGCGTDDGVTTTTVGMSYGAYYGPGYYGPGYYGGYYDPYPPVVVVPPGDGSNRPGGERPTTLPAEVGGPSAKTSMAPSRPSTTSRPTSRPSPRPAPRPMPRGGGMRR
jgi:hypothetical protein